MVLGMTLALKEFLSRGEDKCAHRYYALERGYREQWGKEERKQHFRVLSCNRGMSSWRDPSSLSLSLSLASPACLFAT